MLKCAASMSVGGGYFSDPVGFEGVAHFLGVHCF
jgi:secreted Zn-dependent insulinase-like peptidase